jgi:nucleoside-diphosphate kinase
VIVSVGIFQRRRHSAAHYQENNVANIQQSLIILKPDVIQRGIIGEVISRLEKRGLKIAAMELRQLETATVEQHYDEHRGKGFFAGVVSYMTSGPVVTMVIEGHNAIAQVRATAGATNPFDATPGTIRHDYATTLDFNIIHASANETDAAREIALFFKPEQIVSYTRAIDPWIV